MKSKNFEDRQAFNKQRNLCVKLTRKAKRDYFESLDLKNIDDNRKLWKTIKLFFTEKSVGNEKIILEKDNDILDDNKVIADSYSNFFSKIIRNLNLQKHPSVQNHPSILKIKEKFKNTNNVFTLSEVSIKDVAT